MTWNWRLEDSDGSVVTDQASPTHSNQSDAESWIGEKWRELREAGVAQATLLDGTKVIYGPMSLSEE